MLPELEEIRKLLLCPYSGKLMYDAVIVNCTGETYSYQGLISWWGKCVAEGMSTTCPNTNTVIPAPCKDYCVEAHLVKSIVKVFRAAEGVHEAPSVSNTEQVPEHPKPDDNCTEPTSPIVDESESGESVDSRERRIDAPREAPTVIRNPAQAEEERSELDPAIASPKVHAAQSFARMSRARSRSNQLEFILLFSFVDADYVCAKFAR